MAGFNINDLLNAKAKGQQYRQRDQQNRNRNLR